jgi:hypothetical protein
MFSKSADNQESRDSQRRFCNGSVRPMKSEAEQRLTELLANLSAKLDSRQQAESGERHRRALAWESGNRLPLVIRHPLPPDAHFQPWPHREIFDHPAKMLFNELVHAFDTSIAAQLPAGDDLPWTIRANFGTVVIASLFGAPVEQVGDNPPWVRPDDTNPRTLKSLLEVDPADFSRGWVPRVIERYEYYRETLRGYPALQHAIRVVLPDLQGPVDSLELIIGSVLFTELHDHPDEVTAALRALAVAQVALAKRLAELTTDGPAGFAHQHATMIRGRILIRNDTAILISPEVYRRVVAPHDAFVLRELGGGGIHSCGVVARHAPAFLEVPGVECFDFGQAELNDVAAVYRLAQARKIALIRVWASEEDLLTGRILTQFPTGVSLRHHTSSLAEARRIMEGYRQACARARPVATQ